MKDIKTALTRVLKYEKNLINWKKIRPKEEVVNHQLARRISELGLNVDVEYDADQTTGSRKALHELGKTLRPDIIIHERGSNSNNLCIVECKWNLNETTALRDLNKLFYFMISPTYKYKSAFFVVYRSNDLSKNKHLKITHVKSETITCNSADEAFIKIKAFYKANPKSCFVFEIVINPDLQNGSVEENSDVILGEIFRPILQNQYGDITVVTGFQEAPEITWWKIVQDGNVKYFSIKHGKIIWTLEEPNIE